jgi:hypothetical protein
VFRGRFAAAFRIGIGDRDQSSAFDLGKRRHMCSPTDKATAHDSYSKLFHL